MTFLNDASKYCRVPAAKFGTESAGNLIHSLFQTFRLAAAAGLICAFLAAVTPGQAIAGIESHNGSLLIGGDIVGPDLPLFITAFGSAIKKSAKTGKPLRVELNSDGGDLETAFFMADAIAAAQQSGREIHVEVPVGGRCNSACVVIFAAGSNRHAAPDAKFLLHGVSYAGLYDSPGVSAARQRHIEHFHKAIEGADWQFGQFVRRHGIIENDLNMTFSGRQLFEAFDGFITSLNTADQN